MSEQIVPINSEPEAKIGDHFRSLAILALDKVPLPQALKIAVGERLERDKQMGPPQEPSKEVYNEEYLRLKSELKKVVKE